MFGSSPFGQSSSSPFGSPSVFGQGSNAGSTNPFASNPFGNVSPFGSQTGGSIFGGTSTGVFGAQSSPLGSTPVFGATSSAFGSSTPAFGASTTSAFGSSVFGQKPAFGGFGSTTTQSSPFGGSSQQSQPAFGNSLFGSSAPFGAPSQPAFGTPSTPAFGASSTPAFGASSTPAFGASSTPAFGATSTPAFGSTSNTPFGSTGGAFGMSGSSLFGSSTPAFGATSTPAFGATSTPAFGAISTPAFGATSTPAFGATSTPAFGASTTPAFGASNSQFSFGQSASAFGSSPFGTATTPFGAQSSPFGTQATTAAFGGQRVGTRVTPYATTPEADGTGSQSGRLESISAMPVYKDKSHEELRWEDYQSGDKGGPAQAGQTSNIGSFGNSGFGSATTSAFSQSSPNLFSTTTSTNPFAPKTPGFSSTGFGSTSAPTFNSSPFGVSNTTNPFGSVQSPTLSLFNASTSTFGTSTAPSIFGSSSSTGFTTTPSLFNSSPPQGTFSNIGSGLNFGNTQSSPLFQSTTTTLGQNPLGFGQTNSAFGQNVSPFGQGNSFSSPSTGFGFSSTPLQTQGFGQTTPSLHMPFQSNQPAQPIGTFGFNNFGQTQSGVSGGFGISPSMYGQIQPNTQSSVIAQPMPVINPFGTLPAMPQMSIGRTGTSSSSIQYGISSLPVVDKPAPLRISSLLTSGHLTRRRIRLPARKYHSKSDGPMVPFFGDEEDTPSTPKADALFIPRENPRALVVRPLDQWPSKLSAGKMAPSNQVPLARENEGLAGNGIQREQAQTGRQNQKQNGLHEGATISEKEDSHITLTGRRAGETAISYEHGADIETLMPKLRHPEYYSKPSIQELAAKERAEPGFCRRVREFEVGRRGYGSIKFIGETDVRRLDLESIVQFNNREVVVYPDESKKPPVGQGLNKPAEVTLLNIKFFNKKTGEQLTEGASAERCKDNLMKKSAEQGAEFLSYDPVKGEWKFRVNHFSCYKLEDEDCINVELDVSG